MTKHAGHRTPITSLVVSVAVGLLAGSAQPAAAQAPDPKFDFEKPAEVKEKAEVEWKASANAGVIVTTGNSNTVTVNGGLEASRFDGKNKVQAKLAGAYAESTVLVANDIDGDGQIDGDGEVANETNTTAANLIGKLRYDRFITTNNSLYLSALAGLDRPASKEVFAGGQVGYSRQIVKNETHEVLGEAGYDFTWVRYLNSPDRDVYLHSARLFLGYTLTPTDATTIGASVEALVNFNPVTIGGRDVGAGEATRVNGNLSLTTKVWSFINFRAAFSVRYDNAPSLRQTLDLPYAPGYTPFAEKIDTMTELGLIINFI